MIIRLGFVQRRIRWMVAGLEQWISDRCWSMGYSNYQPPQKTQFCQRIQDAIACASPPSPLGMRLPSPTSFPSSSDVPNSTPPLPLVQYLRYWTSAAVTSFCYTTPHAPYPGKMCQHSIRGSLIDCWNGVIGTTDGRQWILHLPLLSCFPHSIIGVD